MSINLWQRVTHTVRERYRGSALAQYGAGLHTDCDDCGVGPADVAIVVPAPRRAEASAAEGRDRGLHGAVRSSG